MVRILRDTYTDWMEDNALRLSAALAYYSVFSIAPLLVIAVGIAGLVLGEEAVRGQLDDQLKAYLGAQAAQGVQGMVKSAAKPAESVVSAIVGFATLLLGASGVFGQLKDALNTIWEVKAKPSSGIVSFIRDRLLNFGMVLVIGFLLLTSLLLSTVLAAATKYVGEIVQIQAVLGAVLGSAVSIGLATVLFALIFKVLPDAKILWQDVWHGAVVTAVLFEIGKFALGFYLGRESTASSFGAAGSVVLLLLWVYYASCILLFGAEFTQVYAKAAGRSIAPVGQPAQGAGTPAREFVRPTELPASYAPTPRTHLTSRKSGSPTIWLLLGGVLLGSLIRRRGTSTAHEGRA